MDNGLKDQKNNTWKSVASYVILGPLAGYFIILLKETPHSSSEVLIAFIGIFFAYIFGAIPAFIVGLITAFIINIFKFWSNNSKLKFLIFGPMLGAFLSVPTALLFVGEKNIHQIIAAGVMGILIGGIAYKKAL